MAGRARPSLVVTVTDARGRPVGSGGIGRWLARAAPAGARGAVTIALVSDAVMRRLNLQFRGKDYATDVLSFPAQGFVRRPGLQARRKADLKVRPTTPSGSPSLGDIAIATGVARRQAREQGHPLATELRLLALHGLLHLLGYDHEADQGEMRRMEDRLRRRSGLPRGLVSRAASGAAPR